jgi:hypothetical protein
MNDNSEHRKEQKATFTTDFIRITGNIIKAATIIDFCLKIGHVNLMLCFNSFFLILCNYYQIISPSFRSMILTSAWHGLIVSLCPEIAVVTRADDRLLRVCETVVWTSMTHKITCMPLEEILGTC